jgi:hypothetical protein
VRRPDGAGLPAVLGHAWPSVLPVARGGRREVEAAQQTTAPGKVTMETIHVEIKTEAEVPRPAAEYIASEFLEWLEVHTDFRLTLAEGLHDERSFTDLARDYVRENWGLV